MVKTNFWEDQMNNLYGSDTVSKGYYGYSSESGSGHGGKGYKNKSKNQKRADKAAKKLRHSALLGIVMALVQLGLSGFFIYSVLKLNVLTQAFLIGIIAILFVLFLIVFVMECKGKLKTKRVGKAISIIVIVLVGLGIYFLGPLSQLFLAGGNKVDDKPFVVFVSASDTFGALNADKVNSRSDTNIIAAINPKNHTVLMVSIPRDYYIPIIAKDVAPDSYDKLTHIGLYGNGKAYNSEGQRLGVAGWNYAQEVHHWGLGKKVIMKSLKKLLGFQIDKGHYHYAEINFTGFARLIDELGGITVNVDESFKTRTYASYGDEDTGKRKTYKYKKGEMEMDGDTALTFARERHSFSNGDMQRNKNQVKVLNAMSKKAISTNTLLNFRNIVSAASECYDTDMDVASLARLQQSISGGWDIVSFGVIGDPSRAPLTWNGLSKSVVMKNDQSVANANKLIKMALKGTSYKKLKKTASDLEESQK